MIDELADLKRKLPPELTNDPDSPRLSDEEWFAALLGQVEPFLLDVLLKSAGGIDQEHRLTLASRMAGLPCPERRLNPTRTILTPSMKLLNLSLSAVGPFTGLELDLSAGQEGLHLIYGSNEAGKSSALRAVSHLLFGFPHLSADNFVHSNDQLRVGGKLRHSDGTELEIIRRRGNRIPCAARTMPRSCPSNGGSTSWGT